MRSVIIVRGVVRTGKIFTWIIRNMEYDNSNKRQPKIETKART